MLIITIMVLILITGIIIQRERRYQSLGDIILFIGSIITFSSLIVLCASQIGIRGDIQEFLATKTTIEIARKNGVVIENAAIQHKIIECNQWLASKQYYNKTIFDIWIPDEVNKLKPIE